MPTAADFAVVDASVLVAAAVDTGDDGRWASSLIKQAHLSAPSFVRVEATNIMRRLETFGAIEPSVATAAQADLVDLPIDLFPFEAVAPRVWQLRHNLTIYDAFYVAVAEVLEAPLATLDRKLSRAPGPRCPMLLPDEPFPPDS